MSPTRDLLMTRHVSLKVVRNAIQSSTEGNLSPTRKCASLFRIVRLALTSCAARVVLLFSVGSPWWLKIRLKYKKYEVQVIAKNQREKREISPLKTNGIDSGCWSYFIRMCDTFHDFRGIEAVQVPT